MNVHTLSVQTAADITISVLIALVLVAGTAIATLASL
jgi:hypothetical protein